MPWLLAYRIQEEYAFTLADEPFQHASHVLRKLPVQDAGDLLLVWARYFARRDEARAALSRTESLSNEETISLIERDNPDWLDYLVHRPHLLYPPGDDGLAGSPVPRPDPPGPRLFFVHGAQPPETTPPC